MKANGWVVTLSSILVLFTVGCSVMKVKQVYVPEKIVYTTGVQDRISEDVAMVIMVTKQGNVVVYGKDGNAPLKLTALPDKSSDQMKIKECTYPTAAKENMEVCEGLKKGKAVVDSRTITILKSVGSGCITYNDGFGNLVEACW